MSFSSFGRFFCHSLISLPASLTFFALLFPSTRTQSSSAWRYARLLPFDRNGNKPSYYFVPLLFRFDALVAIRTPNSSLYRFSLLPFERIRLPLETILRIPPFVPIAMLDRRNFELRKHNSRLQISSNMNLFIPSIPVTHHLPFEANGIPAILSVSITKISCPLQQF
jgi:hypothetical protein